VPRTTITLDPSVLGQLKRRQHKERKPLSELVNQLLARALAETESADETARPLRWTSRATGTRVDIEDNDALLQALDES
jgi:hypothetical protein